MFLAPHPFQQEVYLLLPKYGGGGGTSCSSSNRSDSKLAAGSTLVSLKVGLIPRLTLAMTFYALQSNLIPDSFCQRDSVAGLPAFGLTVSKKLSCCT
jgi:hypothetical protein